MTKDMTTGSPMKLILGFSIPMLMGLLFQQMYNLVDTMIVGKLLGVQALAAVGATGSLNFLIIGFCLGVCSGFAIPVAQKFGAQDYRGLRKYVANGVWLSLLFSAVMTVLTVVFCKPILKIMQTPDDIFQGSYEYIVIIFIGIPVTYLYNMCSSIIRAVGDSKTPVYFLAMASVMNIVLDIVLILNFQMGVAGAALATVISQGVSGVLCLILIMKKFDILKVRKEEWKWDGQYAASLCNMGVPMGLQFSITAIGSVILQSAVNTLGSASVAAMTAANKIGMFLTCPFDALGSTMATYAGQNVGAGKVERIGKGIRGGILIGWGYSILALICTYCFSGQMSMLFVDSAQTEIIANIKMCLVANALFYVMLTLVNTVRYLIQGMGFGKFSLFSGVFEMIARGVAGFVLVPKYGFVAACFASPLAWVLADCFLVPAYFYAMKKMREMLKKRAEEPALPRRELERVAL